VDSLCVVKIILIQAISRKNEDLFMMFYFGFGLQLIGLTTVGICLFSGMTKGDYGQIELVQLVGGSLIFYVGNFVRGRFQS
tara:strand:- start:237667 stop:237909 length:243 start_codon:yes stop_codon:yes gene_type:complete